MALEKTFNLARQDEIPQQFTSEEMTEIKSAISQETANVNINSVHYYSADEHIAAYDTDGSAIYEKTIDVSGSADVDASSYGIEFENIRGFDYRNTMVVRTNGERCYGINLNFDAFDYSLFFTAYKRNNITYITPVTKLFQIASYRVTVLYTKEEV